MPSTLAPYGFRPINLLAGQSFPGGVRLMKITNSYGTSIFYGDPVKLVSTGTVELDTGTSTLTPVGIFLGCTYTDPNLSYTVQKQMWTASTSATDNYAYVCDDPDQVFMIQCDNSGSALAQTNLGNNIGLATYVAGSTVNGTSAVRAARSTAATTNTLPLRIIDVVTGFPGDAIADTYPNIIVKWNFGMHQYNVATGV
jgi:hypothetical protein